MGLFNSKELEKLRIENEELKTKFHFMYEKENQAEILNKTLINLKKEISDTNATRNELKDTLKELEDKHKRKEREADQINKFILELDKKRFELREAINSYEEEIKNVANIIEEKTDNSDIDFSSIKDANTTDNIELFITNLKNNLVGLKDEEIKLSKVIEEKDQLKGEMEGLIEELETEIKTKRELKDSLQVEAFNLDEQIQQQNNKINEVIEKKKNLDEKTAESEKKLYEIDQSLEIKAKKLSSLNTEILIQQQNVQKIKSEIDKLQAEKEQLKADYAEQSNSLRNYDLKVEKIKELCSLLEIRRGEIEKGNLALENRFTNMFQRYNVELNKINKKRNLLEKIILTKEKEVEIKDQELFMKIASLEESERVLNMRQIEVESLEKYIKTLKEKKDYLLNEINVIMNDFDKQKRQKDLLKNEINLLVENKNKIDLDLQNLVDVMVSSYNRSDERKKAIEKDVKLYDEQLDSYKDKINESINELLETQSSVSGLKLEHEELQSSISKLLRTKKKLQDDITKYQEVVQRYQNIKEKLKIEKALAKNKEIPGPYSGNTINSKVSLDKEAEKTRGSNLFKI